MPKQKRLVVFSGAGLSADSGIPTFRSSDGTWANHDVKSVCYIHSWKANFDLVHGFYNARRRALSEVVPNAMHRLLADWQHRFGAELITQNIDDLLERAGAERVLHVHGTLSSMQCQACGRIWEIGLRDWDQNAERCLCGSRKGVKPNVVFFGERAPAYMPMAKALGSLTREDALVVIGTDGAVVPIGLFAAETPALKVLNTLGPVPKEKWEPGMVSSALFNRTIYRPAAEATTELDEIVSAWMAEPADAAAKAKDKP